MSSFPVLASGRFQASVAVSGTEDPLGELWSGADAWTGDAVTIRVVPGSLMADARRARRVEDQLSRLRWETSSRHLAPVLDHGLRQRAGKPVYVVFGASGEPLSARLDRDGPMSRRRALDLLAAVADALSAAHRSWVTHGALTPASVLVRADGFVAVIDVGLGDLLDAEAEEPRTSSRYQIDRSSDDVFALAALFHRIVGRAEDSGRDQPSGESDVPLELGNLLRRASSPYPSLRPEMAQLAMALAGGRVPTEVSPSLRREAVVTSANPVSSARARPRSQPTPVGPIRSRWWRRPRVFVVAFATALALGTGALAGVVLSREREYDAQTPARSPVASSEPSPTVALVPATVPNILGGTVERATTRLEEAGLVVGEVTMVRGDPGLVVRTEPTQGEAVVAGSAVDLFVGDGEGGEGRGDKAGG